MFAVVRLPLPVKFAALFLLASASLMLVTSGSQAQRARASAQAGGDDPAFNEFKGVRLGMTVDETRKKLGDPKDKSDEQDFYLFGDKLAAQVPYKLHKVVTISIDFMGGEAPSPKQVLGADVEAKPDGSMNKVVRYPKAGYWVCYNRTAGDSPVISITMQKIEQ